MYSNNLHYLPGPTLLYLVLGGIVAALFVLLEIGILDSAYRRLGLGRRTAILVLVASLLGSYVNIPIARMPETRVVLSGLVDAFGMPYYAPQLVDWPGTIVAINVGGAAIPTLLSLYLIVHDRILILGAIATAVMAVIVHQLATPIAGVGISVPLIAPPLIAALTALILSRRYAAALAYICGSLGVLIGADISNLDKLPSLGAPVASIGGAGTFDGVFLTGIVAVLLAGIGERRA